jgi:surfeit locus 1 family protein
MAFCALVFLGAWQIQRLAWKEALLAKIAALQQAPARPLEVVLAGSGSLEFRRVQVTCQPSPPQGPTLYRYAVQDGRIGWRLLSSCKLAAPPFDGILVDRGLVTALTSQTAPRAAVYPAPIQVVGILRAPGATPWLGPALMDGGPGFMALRVADRTSILRLAGLAGLRHPVPYLLAVETETPPAPGLKPIGIPADIPNNHLIYAMTWFALAGILGWFYLAMLIQRRRR